MGNAQCLISTVLFDIGGVLVTHRPDAAKMAQVMNMDTTPSDTVKLVDHSIWFHRDAYDAGCSDREFWDHVAGDCGLGELSDATIAALVQEDITRFDLPDPDALELVCELKARGMNLGILSNAPHAIADRFPQLSWAEAFDHFTFSAPLGVCKPAQRIYKEAIARSGVPADNSLFIDDRQPNIRAATLAGMHTIQWTDPATAREALVNLNLLDECVAAS